MGVSFILNGAKCTSPPPSRPFILGIRWRLKSAGSLFHAVLSRRQRDPARRESRLAVRSGGVVCHATARLFHAGSTRSHSRRGARSRALAVGPKSPTPAILSASPALLTRSANNQFRLGLFGPSIHSTPDPSHTAHSIVQQPLGCRRLIHGDATGSKDVPRSRMGAGVMAVLPSQSVFTPRWRNDANRNAGSQGRGLHGSLGRRACLPGDPVLAPDTVRRHEPADAILNTEAGEGDAAPPSTPRLPAPMSEDRTGDGVIRPEPP